MIIQKNPEIKTTFSVDKILPATNKLRNVRKSSLSVCGKPVSLVFEYVTNSRQNIHFICKLIVYFSIVSSHLESPSYDPKDT